MSIVGRCVIVLLGLSVGLFGWGEHIQSIQAEFEQHIVSEDGIPAHYKGRIFGQSPNKAKWLYEVPLKKEIYMNEDRVIIYEPDLEQASYSRLKNKLDFISILHDAKKHRNGTYRTRLDGVEYVLFVDKNNQPERIEFVDSLGNQTILKLKNVKINTLNNVSLFEFILPEGVEVIELK